MTWFSRAEYLGDIAAIASPYLEHQRLFDLFQGNTDERWLFRRAEDRRRRRPRYYVVSQTAPRENTGVWQIQVKPYAPKLVTGQRLAFTLRANPVVSRRVDGRKSARHDVVMDLKRKHSGSSRRSQAWLEREAGLAWLSRKAERHGFVFDANEVIVSRYQQHELNRAKAANPIRYSTLDFDGRLSVGDPDLLRRSLSGGIGPAKGFGCGLLLLRRL